jgi:uncharacterized protein (TIGR00255 family)
MLSMTGYGAGSVAVGPAAITVEARAVNHRFLDVRVRFPPALFDHAAAAEEVARKLLARGRVELSARCDGRLGGKIVLDRERAKAALHELHELKTELGHPEPVPLSLLSSVPGLFAEEALSDPDQVRAAVRTATQAACRALTTMRAHEGAALAHDFSARLQRIEQLAAEIAARIPELSVIHREKLRARIAALLEGTGTVLEPNRLEQEVALIADRADVTEETTRLQSHCRQFAGLIAAADEQIGRRLEFLLQEMGREINTLGSKLTDLRVTASVLDLKAELERMREQVQNVL